MTTLKHFQIETAKEVGYDTWAQFIEENALKGRQVSRVFFVAAMRYAQHRYEEGLKADRWISVKEHGDPVSHTPFLVLEADGTQSVDEIIWHGNNKLDWRNTTPIAYQPLPPLPAEQETKNQ